MDVVLYSTHCPRCNVLKAKLDAKNVSYKEINDVSEMEKLGIMTAPTLVVDGRFMDFGLANKWVNEWSSEA